MELNEGFRLLDNDLQVCQSVKIRFFLPMFNQSFIRTG